MVPELSQEESVFGSNTTGSARVKPFAKCRSYWKKSFGLPVGFEGVHRCRRGIGYQSPHEIHQGSSLCRVITTTERRAHFFNLGSRYGAYS